MIIYGRLYLPRFLFTKLKMIFLAKYQNVARWWKNISSFSSEFASFAAGSAPAAEEDDDDVDLFGSDDEEDDAEAEKIKVTNIIKKKTRSSKLFELSNFSGIFGTVCLRRIQ